MAHLDKKKEEGGGCQSIVIGQLWGQVDEDGNGSPVFVVSIPMLGIFKNPGINPRAGEFGTGNKKKGRVPRFFLSYDMAPPPPPASEYIDRRTFTCWHRKTKREGSGEPFVAVSQLKRQHNKHGSLPICTSISLPCSPKSQKETEKEKEAEKEKEKEKEKRKRKRNNDILTSVCWLLRHMVF
jgi:hypothetical protein